MPITHTKHSDKIDDADTTLVRPSDWNAEHTFSLSSADISDGLTAAQVVDLTDGGTTILHTHAGIGETVGAVPVGGIIMWSGTIATIPVPTWQLCDGTANAPGPDLRDKFIVGATADNAGAAKTNIEGSLKISGGTSAVQASAHANLSHANGAVGDHTGLTHGLTIANHPDLTHVALASHPALTIEGATHANISLPSYSHPVLTIEGATHAVLTIEGMTHAVQSIASRQDLSGAGATHPVLTIEGMTHANISLLGLTHSAFRTINSSIGSNGTLATLVTGSAALASHPTGTTSIPSHPTFTASAPASHPTHAVSFPAWSISPASHPTFTASAPASHPTFTASAPAAHESATVGLASHPTFTASGLTHAGVGTHVGTDYGVHTSTAPAAHGTAGTVTHSFTQPDVHTISAHDSLVSLPNYFALAFIQRMI